MISFYGLTQKEDPPCPTAAVEVTIDESLINAARFAAMNEEDQQNGGQDRGLWANLREWLGTSIGLGVVLGMRYYNSAVF
jgi:hypothetical protein